MKELLTIDIQGRKKTFMVQKVYELDDGTVVYMSNSFPQTIRIKNNEVHLGKSVYKLVAIEKNS